MVTNNLSQLTKLTMAKRIAKDYGYFIVNMGSQVQPSFLLYKEDSPRNRFVAKRSSVDGLLSLVKTATGFK
jgi:hypothetical protein